MPETAAITAGLSLWRSLLHSAAHSLSAYLLWESKILLRPETKQPSIFPSSFTILDFKRKDVERGRYLSIKIAFAATHCTEWPVAEGKASENCRANLVLHTEGSECNTCLKIGKWENLKFEAEKILKY